MGKEVNKVVTKILTLNFLIGFVLFFIIQFTFKKYGLYFLLGLLLATINLMMNTIVTQMVLIKNKNHFFSIIGFVLRVLTVALSVVFIYSYNLYYAIAFLLGYCANFISIIIYGITLAKNKA
ncbi:ATP synthase subunit I [Clostridium oceanicum]|uniref:ATP synthase subunit I n=1 Tax=Clostridium oceanicum TaxID=1543 RepID=A0ABN1JPU3_9CLOT